VIGKSKLDVKQFKNTDFVDRKEIN